MNRKLFAFGILAVLALGCSDDSSDNNGATCNNGVLEGNEVCDGSFFAAGMRACPAGYELKAGMTTESIMCTATCTVNTSAACVPVAAPACGNGRLDIGEVCDGALFAAGKQVCPEGYQLKAGKTTQDITCNACQVVTDDVCEVPATCGNNALDDGEACDGTLFAAGKQVCPEGYQLKADKTVQDITCNACQVIIGEACEAATPTAVCGNDTLDEGEACDGTIFAVGKQMCPAGYQFKIGKSVQDITCNACQVVTDEACEPEGSQETVISCDGDTLKTCHGDNPDNCTSVDCTKDGKICAKVEGVSACVDSLVEESTCENGVWTYRLYDYKDPENSLEEVTVCADKGLVCGEDEDGQPACVEEVCQATDVDKADCIGNVLRICSLNDDTDATGVWLTEDCAKDTNGKTVCDASKSACVMPAPEEECGNGVLDNGEACDPKATPMFPTWRNVTCNYYASSNGTKIYVSGAPTCTDKCKVDISGCVEVTETDFSQLYKWSFTSLQSITDITANKSDYTKAGAIKMEGVFGNGMSKYDNGGWSLGNWGNSFGKSIVFSAGASSKDGIRVTMDVKRSNTTNSPKMINVRLLDGNSSIVMGTPISLSGTDKTTVNFDFVLNASYQDLRAAFTAYDAKTDAHIVINNIAIKEANAI